MEELKYIVEDSTIAELLGVQNFTNKEAAILELVKNAFDANAMDINLSFSKDLLLISDNGCGMNGYDIRRHWMHVGKSDKGYQTKDMNGNKRVLAGSKGVGRFALARLGTTIKMKSRKENENTILWETDWNKSILNESNAKNKIGTQIKICGLRDKWSEKAVILLADYLGRTYCDDIMKINILYEDKSIPVIRYFISPIIGVNYTTKICLSYDSKDRMMKCIIDSDEFLEEAQKYCPDFNIAHYEKNIDMVAELENVEFDSEIENMDELLNKIGNFDADFYFGMEKILVDDEKKFLYKRNSLIEKFEPGIILFRNSFSISSYEGKKDWLELGKRSRKSPAAATHPTGSWRVRENQLSGKVNIDKKNNPYLQDLSNRQGLDENIYYHVFVKILQEGLSEFEYYRQNIIRAINAKNKEKKQEREQITDKVLKNPNSLKNLTKNEESKFISELKGYKKERQQFKKDIDSTEKRYKYDVRLLNVLATSGLKATSIAHELKNDRNNIDGNYEFIVDALKKYELWEILNSPEKTKYEHLNIPALLESNKYTSDKILQFMDTMLEEVEKRQFFAEEYNIKQLMIDIKSDWERDYAWIKIELDINENIAFVLPEDIVNVVFDNLILNSIQQNDTLNLLHILISISRVDDFLYIKYKDNGRGLASKYLDSPRKILEPHETSRKKGHGLGMWIINNTLEMSGGRVIKITSDNGFGFEFIMGGNL